MMLLYMIDYCKPNLECHCTQPKVLCLHAPVDALHQKVLHAHVSATFCFRPHINKCQW